MKVLKFGGTSVGSAQRMKEVAKLITDGEQKIVVLSAMSGTTNTLVEISDYLYKKNPEGANEIINKLESKYKQHVDELFATQEYKQKGLEVIKSHFDYIRSYTKDLFTLFEEKVVLAQGELISTAMVNFYLQECGVKSVLLPALEFMRTDKNAEPDPVYIKEKLQTQLELYPDMEIYITQGFICRNAYGEVDNLQRGGSDYTAALLGEALNATRVDIWTDVPGIYTTDPRVAPAAKRIDVIAFEEAAEMATFGAKVLHPATLLPAVRSDIPVFVGSSKEPKAGGTLVCKTTENPPLFRALALRRRQTLLTLHSLNMLHSRGFLAEVFGILARHNISVDLITTSEVSVALTMDTTGSTSAGDTLLTQALLTELSSLCRVEVEENLALVALIGNELSKACGVGKEVFGVLEPFNIRMICYGASSHNLCFLVPGDDAEKVVQKLHHNLFE